MIWQSNTPISKLCRPCNEFTSVWSMFPCNTITLNLCCCKNKTYWTMTPDSSWYYHIYSAVWPNNCRKEHRLPMTFVYLLPWIVMKICTILKNWVYLFWVKIIWPVLCHFNKCINFCFLVKQCTILNNMQTTKVNVV